MSLSLLICAAAAAGRSSRPTPEWSWAVVAEPVDFPTGGDTAFEVEHAISGDRAKPMAVSLAYWGHKSTTSGSDTVYSVKHATDDHDLEGLAVRYKFYPGRHTFFNVGAG